MNSCTGCYCTPRLAAESVEVTSGVLYSNETWVSRLTGKTEPFWFDVYRSNHTASDARLPAVMLIHGGGFNRGSKTDRTIVSEAHWLAQHGFVAYSISYRLTAAVGLPDVGSVR